MMMKSARLIASWRLECVLMYGAYMIYTHTHTTHTHTHTVIVVRFLARLFGSSTEQV